MNADKEIHHTSKSCPELQNLCWHLPRHRMGPYKHVLLKVPQAQECYEAVERLPYYTRKAALLKCRKKPVQGMVLLFNYKFGICDQLFPPLIDPFDNIPIFHASLAQGRFWSISNAWRCHLVQPFWFHQRCRSPWRTPSDTCDMHGARQLSNFFFVFH